MPKIEISLMKFQRGTRDPLARSNTHWLAKTLAAFCRCPKNLSDIVCLGEELSRQNDTKVVSWLLLTILGL